MMITFTYYFQKFDQFAQQTGVTDVNSILAQAFNLVKVRINLIIFRHKYICGTLYSIKTNFDMVWQNTMQVKVQMGNK